MPYLIFLIIRAAPSKNHGFNILYLYIIYYIMMVYTFLKTEYNQNFI